MTIYYFKLNKMFQEISGLVKIGIIIGRTVFYAYLIHKYVKYDKQPTNMELLMMIILSRNI